MSIKQQVRQFILSNYLFSDDESKLADAESLMQSGTMDSTGILELIMFLEETFEIKVGDDENETPSSSLFFLILFRRAFAGGAPLI